MSNFKERENLIIADFENQKTWEDKYKKIINLGKELPTSPPDLHQEKFLIKGCQSQVWLKAELCEGKVILFADSDALIVKGLVAILVKLYSGLNADEILTNPPDFISKLGFSQHLSPSRANGFSSMIKQIFLYATAFKALSKSTT